MMFAIIIVASLHNPSSIFYLNKWIRQNNEAPITVQEIPPLPTIHARDLDLGPSGNWCIKNPLDKRCING